MFDHKEDYLIANEVAELSVLQMDHLEQLYPVSDDAAIWEFMTDEAYGRQNFETYIKRAIQKRDQGQEYTFALKDLRTNEFAGMTRVYSLSNKMKNARIGHTWIGKKFQGTGLNKHMKYLLFEFLFDKMKMQRIGFGANEQNVKGLKAMESVGCRKEGVLRAYLPANDAKTPRRDIALYSILKEDWDANVKRELQLKLHS